MKHKAKVLTKEEIEQNRSNAYTYINFESENEKLPFAKAIRYTPLLANDIT